MFQWFHLNNVMNTPEEWHAFVVGFCEALCPWHARVWMSGDRLNELLAEYHYYMAGRGLGFVALVFVLLGIAKFILEVLL